MYGLCLVDSVDMRLADDPQSSQAFALSKLTLPSIKRKTVEHSSASGLGAVKFTLSEIEPLEPKFELKGFSHRMIQELGFSSDTPKRWFFTGLLRDKISGKPIPIKAIIQGTVSEWEPDAISAGDLFGGSYAFSEVTHYEVLSDNTEIWYWDFYEKEGRANGVSWMAPIRAAHSW